MTDYDEYIASQSRAYMEHVRRLVSRRGVWALTIEQDEALLDGLRGIDYTREKVGGTAQQADIDSLLARLEANRAQHLANMAELVETVEDAQRRVALVDEPVLARLLLLRYVDDMAWEEVGRQLRYDPDHCRKFLHDKALVALFPHLPTEWRDPRPSAV